MHWRAVLLSLLALAAAVLYAVQRETAVRQWLLRPAAQELAAVASLGRVLPDVRLTNATLDEAAAELSRLGGVPIRVDPGVYAARMGDPGSVTLCLRGVTLAEAVATAMAPAGGGPECYPTIVPRGGELLVLMPADARRLQVVRAHDVDDLLPPDGPPPPWSGGGLFSGNVRPLSDRQQAVDDLTASVESDLEEQPGSPVIPRWSAGLGPVPTRMFGARLIVTVPAVDQARVPQQLAAVRRGGRLKPRVTAE